METNGDYQKLIKAMLSQKCYEQVKNDVENGVEVDDSVFNQADFNDDGKVDENDKNLFEEYIKNYEELFGEVDIDYSKLEEMAQESSETEKSETDSQNSEKLNELKQQCLETQALMNEAQKKYDIAVQKSKSAKERQENLEAKTISMQARLESEKQRYNEILIKRMKQNQNAKNGGKNSYDEQLSEAKKSRDNAARQASLAQSEYGMASANKAYYDSQVTSNKSELDKLTQTYNALSSEFGSIYDGLSEEEKSKYGENPFITNNDTQQ